MKERSEGNSSWGSFSSIWVYNCIFQFPDGPQKNVSENTGDSFSGFARSLRINSSANNLNLDFHFTRDKESNRKWGEILCQTELN